MQPTRQAYHHYCPQCTTPPCLQHVPWHCAAHGVHAWASPQAGCLAGVGPIPRASIHLQDIDLVCSDANGHQCTFGTLHIQPLCRQSVDADGCKAPPYSVATRCKSCVVQGQSHTLRPCSPAAALAAPPMAGSGTPASPDKVAECWVLAPTDDPLSMAGNALASCAWHGT